MEEFHLCSQFYTYSCVPALVRAKTTNDWFLSPDCSDDTDPAMVVPLPPVLRQSGSKLPFIPGAPEWLFSSMRGCTAPMCCDRRLQTECPNDRAALMDAL